MRLSSKQVRALSGALAETHKQGLEKSGRSWHSSWESHDHNTIMSLVDRGYINLYVTKTVAHITDIGREALEAWREQEVEA